MFFLDGLKIAGLMVVPSAICWYLATYGLWAWRQGLRRGAVGVLGLAAVTFGVSLAVIGTR